MFESSVPTCVECGLPLQELDLTHARRLVACRRRADERRVADRMSAELDLGRFERESGS